MKYLFGPTKHTMQYKKTEKKIEKKKQKEKLN